MKQFFVIPAILLSSLVLTGCKNKLDRNKAKEVLTKYYRLPAHIEAEQFMSTYSYRGMFLFDKDYNIAPLVQANLINHQHYISNGTIYDITAPTASTKQYIDSGGYEQNVILFRLADIAFGDVTEISQEDNSKTVVVTFTLACSNVTPFGKARTFFRPNDYTSEIRKAVFMLTDNGWTVQETKPLHVLYHHNE